MAANNNKEYDVEDVVVMSFKTDKGVLGTAKEALETYRIMDIVLDEYYSGRDKDFWNRIDDWNKNTIKCNKL